MALGGSSDSNGGTQPRPNPLHLWERFRNSQKTDKLEEKPIRQLSNRHRQTRDNIDNSSGKSVETSRRTIVTEQVFTRQLQNHRQSRDSSYTTDSSFDSSTDRPRGYLRRHDYSNKENGESVNTTGLLHLKKPMSTNNDNHKKYYEARGRMEPINWNNDQSTSIPSSSNHQEKTPEIKKKSEVPKETLRSITSSKSAVSDEFSNFVKNSVDPKKDAFNIQGNVETKASTHDCPLYKIEQLISKKPYETITIPASVRTSFLPSPPAFHLFNRIDTFKVLDPMRKGDPTPAHTSRHDEAHTSQHRHRHEPRENMNSRPTHTSRQDETRFSRHGVPNGSSNYRQYRRDGADYVNLQRAGPNGNSGYNQYKNNEKMTNNAPSAFNGNDLNRVSQQNGKFPVSNDVKSTDQDNQQGMNRFTKTNYSMKNAQNAKPAGNKDEKMVPDLWSGENCDADDDMISYVNSLSHEENVAKRQSRKQAMEVDDDLFGFVKNPPESSSSKDSNLPAPPAREINTCKYNFDRLQAVCKEQQKPRPYKTLLGIFKKKEQPKLNKTLDSDDTVNVSSDLESASASVISTRDRFKAYRQKQFEKEALSKLNGNQPILPDENDDRKVLENKNQLLNRCLRASHDYMKVHEDNVIEITNVKVGPKPEPLLKPISTRYFPKSSTDADEPSNDAKSDLMEAEHVKPSVSMSTTEVINSTSVEYLPEDKQEKSNAGINNISSITTSSIKDVDSKSDLKSEPTNRDESVKVDKEEKDVDSGFCIKSIDNSAIAPDVSEIKLDCGTKNDDNCEVLKLEELTESTLDMQTKIDKNCTVSKEFTESNITPRKIELNIEPKNQQPTKSSKDECKFETITSDSDNESMDDYVINYDDFEIENIHMWFPDLARQVDNLQQLKSYGAGNSNEIMRVTDYPNNINQSLESDLEISDNNDSSANASFSDSDNPFSPSSGINFDSVFEKVDIKFSELNTKGLDSNYSQTTDFSNQKVPTKDKGVHLDLHPINSTENTSKETSLDIKELKEEIESNSSDNHDLSAQHSEEPKSGNDKLEETPKPPSKKLQKYRNTLRNYKSKLETKVETKQDDSNVPQPDNVTQKEDSQPQESRSRQILKEIQKHKLHLTLKKFV